MLTYLENEFSISISLDRDALDELGLGPDEPVSIGAKSLNNVKSAQALRLVLDPLELTYCIDGGVVVVTTQEEALTKLSLAVYDVRDLVTEGDYNSLIDIIASTIAPDTWADNGGGVAQIRSLPQRGCLVISQTTTAHGQIGDLLSALRQPAVNPNVNPARSGVSGGGGFGFGGGKGGGGFGGGAGAFAVPDAAVRSMQ